MTRVGQSVPVRAERGWWCGLWLAALLLCVGAVARAEPLPVAGNTENLWIVLPGPDKNAFRVGHRSESDPPKEWQQALDFTGSVGPGCVAATGNNLWMVCQPGWVVQSLEFVPDAPVGALPYNEPRLRPSLPAVAGVLSTAAGAQGAWVLVRVSDRQVLDAIDGVATMPSTQPAAPSTQPNAALNDLPAILRTRPEPIRDILGAALTGGSAPAATQPGPAASTTRPQTQSAASTAPATEPATLAATEPAAPPAGGAGAVGAAGSTVRLLRLQGTAWVKADLPEDWPAHPSAYWVVMLRDDDQCPALVAVQSAPEAQRVMVYRYEDNAWRRHDTTLGPGGQLLPVAVDGQLVVGQAQAGGAAPEGRAPGTASPEGAATAVSFAAIEPQGAQPLGELPLPSGPDTSWGLAAEGHAVALVALAQGKLTWAQITLMGKVTPPTPLVEQVPPTFYMTPRVILQLAAFLLALVVIALCWRREAEVGKLKLPEGMMAGDLLRRALAAAIDLLPCAVVACLVFGVGPRDLVPDHMTRGPGGWRELAPGLVAIGLFVLYGFVAEVFTAATPGKRLLGLRVTALNGAPPNLWQVLARNLFKALDLIAPALLLLPFIRPHGQRLGDMVARTLVLQHRPKDEPDRDEGDEE